MDKKSMRISLMVKGIINSSLVLFALLCSWNVAAESAIYFVHNDHLGTPQVLTKSDQEVVWKADYRPFGEAVVDEDPDGDGVSVEFNMRFPGQYHDKETGYYYNYYRTYDPSLGRYIQSDPIGVLKDYIDPQMQVALQQGIPLRSRANGGGLNHLCGYVDQNTIGNIDPFGLFQTAIRPLGGLGGFMSSTPFQNLHLWHEQGFYEDGTGDNVGFFDTSDGRGEVRRDEDIGGYQFLPGHYNDELMREAEAMVRSGEYDLINNNCQDFADRLRGAYRYLMCRRWGICSLYMM